MRNILIAIMTFGILISQSFVASASSIDTNPTNPGLSCSKPNSFSAHSDPLTCTNHYEVSGYCTQGAEGPGGNPHAVIAAGRAIYTVTSDWNGYSQKFVQHFSLSGGYRDRDQNKGKVVSHCSTDPMLNKVSCKAGPIVWSAGYTDSAKDEPGLRGLFPIIDTGISRAALRKQLMAHSTGPKITAPKEYQKFKRHNILVVLKAALPCGMGLSAKTAALMIQKEKDVPSANPQFDTVTWVDAGTRKVKITNNSGIVKLTNLTTGTWRVKAQVYSPASGQSGNWRTFTILGNKGKAKENLGANTMTATHHINQQSGQSSKQQSNQQNSQNAKRRFGRNVMNKTASKTGLPAVQQHKNVRFGGKRTSKLALHQQAPAMHTLSGHLPSNKTHERIARAGSYKARQQAVLAAHLKLLQKRETTEHSCANLDRFITIRQTLYNAGGALAAGQAQLYVQERGGAHIQSQHIRVPAMAHGAKVVLTLKAGTQARYRSKVPGMHRLPIILSVHGKATRSLLTVRLPGGFCQLSHPRVQRSSGLNARHTAKPALHRFTVPTR